MLVAEGPWAQFTEWVNDLVVQHWVKALLAGLVFVLTTAVGSYKAWWALKRRRFYSRFHFSLNVIQDGRLLIRTVDELEADDVLLRNGTLRRRLLREARRTKPGKPFLDLGPHTWTTLNAALNELARLIGSQGWLACDVGLPVRVEDYIIGLTCECDADVRTRKVRLMIVREETLRGIAGGRVPKPRFEQPHHSVRWETLKEMAAIYRQETETGLHRLMRMQVALPAAVVEPASDETDRPAEATEPASEETDGSAEVESAPAGAAE